MERKVKYSYEFKLRCVEEVLKKHRSVHSVANSNDFNESICLENISTTIQVIRLKFYQQLSKENKIIQSMSRKGNCLDNAVIENFFGILKSELFYLKKYESINQLKHDIIDYINYYNNDRIKLNLKGMSPIQYRAHYYQN